MEISNILIILGIIIANGILILTSWMNMKLKIKEIEVRITKFEIDFKKHCDDDKELRKSIYTNIKDIQKEVKEQNISINDKLDHLLERFEQFRVDVEKRINK